MSQNMTNNDSKNIKKSQSIILGTKPSFINAQLLISTGIPSLDTIIGGGLPIGTILLLEEDKYGNYAKIILKYFLAEGCVAKHNLFIASQDFPPDKLITELPAVISCEEDKSSRSAVSAASLSVRDAERMKIAWRYENMKASSSDPLATKSKNYNKYNNDFGNFFDLTKKMDPSFIDRDRIFCLSDSDITAPPVGGDDDDDDDDNFKFQMGFRDCRYPNLLKKIQRELKSGGFYVTDKPEKRNIMRIVIHGLGSRLWISDVDPEDHGDLIKFFYCFRSLMRYCYAVAAISVPDIFEDDTIMKRIENLSDTAIALESFAGSSKETNPIFKDYHGLLNIKKLSAINTLAPHCPASYDLAFKMRRKKFIIEILHLPPDFGEEKEENVGGSFGCGSSKLLDF